MTMMLYVACSGKGFFGCGLYIVLTVFHWEK